MRTRLNSMEIMLIIHRGISVKLSSVEENVKIVFVISSDNWGRKWCHLVAIDAIFFRDKTAQYQMNKVERELFKAYAGFRPIDDSPDSRFAIATGNWGCGAFNGDRQLKGKVNIC